MNEVYNKCDFQILFPNKVLLLFHKKLLKNKKEEDQSYRKKIVDLINEYN